MTEINEGRSFDGPYGSYVHLDLTHLGEKLIDEKLPFVKELAERYLGMDPVHEPIPVRPGQHYQMGGVHTDIHGFTGVAGLYAAGEAACVSINGANRLGSSSRRECLVFGAEAGRSAASFAMTRPPVGSNPVSALVKAEESRVFDGLLKREGGENLADVRSDMQHTMDESVGIYRSGEVLEK